MTTVTGDRAATDVEAQVLHRVTPGGSRRAPFWKSPVLIRMLILAAVLGSWEVSASRRWVDPLFTSRPSEIAVALLGLLPTAELRDNVAYTMAEVAIGFAIGVSLGALIGFVLSASLVLRQACQPVLNALNSVPRIALVPLFVAWFGFGMMPRIAMAVTVVVFVVASTVLAALTQPDRDAAMLARSLGASRSERLIKFDLPKAMPGIIAGLELGLIYAFLGVIGAEILAGNMGLGARMALYANLFQADMFFAFLVVLTVISTVLAAALRYGERRLLHWHRYES